MFQLVTKVVAVKENGQFVVFNKHQKCGKVISRPGELHQTIFHRPNDVSVKDSGLA